MRSSEEVPVANDEPGTGENRSRDRWRVRWRSWRPWLSLAAKPARRGVLIFILLLVIEYLVVPELVGASKDLYLLGRVNAGWVAAGVVLEGVSLFCYAVLTKVLLPPGPKPSLSRLFRIDLSAAAVAHVDPGRDAGHRGARVQAVHRRGHLRQRRHGDDGGQGDRLDRGAERAAVALPGHLHPAGGVPPHLRDGRHHRDDRAGRGRRPGVRRHPGGRVRFPGAAGARRQDPLPERGAG